MSYSAKILADSISPDKVRLVTFEVTFPRFILAEVNTHRMLSRNSASSRAIPPERQIVRAQEDPFIPLTFNQRVKGMGVGDILEDQERCREIWLTARDNAVEAATALNKVGVDKSRVNRLLEPFLWHTAIISATEWRNFFGLRDHPAAQPEFQIIAKLMREAMEWSVPAVCDYDDWHLPLVRVEERLAYKIEICKRLSASRCARVSFDKHTDKESIDDTLARADKLAGSVPAHLSPFEHVARPITPDEARDLGGSPTQVHVGNFYGWMQMRKEIAYEFDAMTMIEGSSA